MKDVYEINTVKALTAANVNLTNKESAANIVYRQFLMSTNGEYLKQSTKKPVTEWHNAPKPVNAAQLCDRMQLLSPDGSLTVPNAC